MKGETPDVLAHVWDRACVTILFSFEWSGGRGVALRALAGEHPQAHEGAGAPGDSRAMPGWAERARHGVPLDAVEPTCG